MEEYNQQQNQNNQFLNQDQQNQQKPKQGQKQQEQKISQDQSIQEQNQILKYLFQPVQFQQNKKKIQKFNPNKLFLQSKQKQYSIKLKQSFKDSQPFIIHNLIKCYYHQNHLKNQKQFFNIQFQKCQFICSTRGCKRYPVICNVDSCHCQQDHKNCKIITIQKLINKIQSKINLKNFKNQKIHLKQTQFNLYIDSKLQLYNFMINRISLEKNQFQKWVNSILKPQEKEQQNKTNNKSNPQESAKKQKNKAKKKQNNKPDQIQPLYLFGFTKFGRSLCTKMKLGLRKKSLQLHKKCGCVPIKLNSSKQLIDFQSKKFSLIIKKIQKSYGFIIDCFQQIVEQINQLQIKSFNLNFAQYQIAKRFLRANNILSSKNTQNDFQRFTGNTVFIANNLAQNGIDINYNPKNNDQLSQNIQIKEDYAKQIKIVAKASFNSILCLHYQSVADKKSLILNERSINYLRKNWKLNGQKIFNRFVEGTAIFYSDLFPQDQKYFKNNQVQNQRSIIANKILKIEQYLNNYDVFFKNKVKIFNTTLKKFDPSIIKGYSKIFMTTQFGLVYCYNRTGISVNIQPRKNALKILFQYFRTFKHIRQIHYTKYSDYKYLQVYMQNNQINKAYKYTENHTFNDYLSIEQTLKLVKSNKKLFNINIINPQNKLSGQIIANLQNIKSLSIGMDTQSIKYFSIYQRFQTQLFKLRSLQNLCIKSSILIEDKNLRFTDFLLKIIENNKSLKSLVICPQIQDLQLQHLLKGIFKLRPNFQQLVFQKQEFKDKINIKYLFKLENLRILNLNNIFLDYEIPSNFNFNIFSKLKHLQTNSTQFVKFLFNYQSFFKQAQTLNLKQFYRIQLGLKNFENLKNLYFSFTQRILEYKQIQQIFTSCKKIEGLSIRGFTLGKQKITENILKLDNLSQQGLKYLNIQHCLKIKFKQLTELKNVEYINKDDPNVCLNSIKYLRNKGIMIKRWQ